MSLLDDLKPAGAKTPPGATDPKKKRQQRIMIAVAGGAVLALIFLMQRRGRSAQPTLATVGDPAQQQALPGSTFADNGSSMADFTSTVGGALGGVASGQQGVADAIDRQTIGYQDLIDFLKNRDAPVTDGTTPSTTGTNSGQQTGGSTNAAKDAKKTPPDEFGRTTADRSKIRAERTAGKEDRRGWTPTEIALAKKNPKYKTTLEARANREAKAANKPLPFPPKKDPPKPPDGKGGITHGPPAHPGTTGGTPAPAPHASPSSTPPGPKPPARVPAKKTPSRKH